MATTTPVHTTLPVPTDPVTTVDSVLDPPPPPADPVTTVDSVLDPPPPPAPDDALKKRKKRLANDATVRRYRAKQKKRT